MHTRLRLTPDRQYLCIEQRTTPPPAELLDADGTGLLISYISVDKIKEALLDATKTIVLE